eukprot:scaffold21476_cov77-Isochrysis_galbana.AAC.1
MSTENSKIQRGTVDLTMGDVARHGDTGGEDAEQQAAGGGRVGKKVDGGQAEGAHGQPSRGHLVGE